MIQSIQIDNFQSHKESTLEFDKGMNVIIGQSDCGKTAIIRAIRLVMYNRPGGDEFRSTWGGDTRVTITTDENEIVRLKTNKLNQYWLGFTEFNAFGMDVPEEITKALNMSEVNLQQQLDAPFLLSSTSGNVAVHFNKVAKLDKIDRGTTNVQKHINTITQNIKSTEKTIVTKKEELETFIDLKTLEKDLIKIEDLNYELLKAKSKATELALWNVYFIRVQNKIESKFELVIAEDPINEILKLYKDKQNKYDKYKELRRLSLKIYHLHVDIEKSENGIAAEDGINNILDIYLSLAETSKSFNQLQKVYTSITDNEKAHEIALKLLSELEKEFHDNFPDICPLCSKQY